MLKQIKKLADRMDLSAEDINAHDFVLTHRALAILAVRTIGEEATLQLMKALSKEKGLPGLTGVCGGEPARGTLLRRLGISETWEGWDFPHK